MIRLVKHGMHLAFALLVACSLLLLLGCSAREATAPPKEDSMEQTQNHKPETASNEQHEIYLAGGCFWGLEAYYQRVDGIIDTEVGYANGESDQADYRNLSRTGHAETVRIVYDPNVIHLAEILDRYVRVIDPLSVNRQGNDVGAQYRTGIYYTDEVGKQVGSDTLDALEQELGQKSAVEFEELRHFVPAEPEHQDYLINNPGGYCHINLNDADKIMYPGHEKPSDAELQEDLSELSYNVTQKADTERPGTSEYNTFDTPGIYVDIVTGQPLFSTDDQYNAGCGWPSFTKPVTTDVILYSQDNALGMSRIEVTSEGGDSHLGHVFEDGPQEEGGLRYCINGASLRFIPYDSLDDEGYGSLKPYVQIR